MNEVMDTLSRILDTKLYESNLRYCLVDFEKHPYRVDGQKARVNMAEDFVEFEELLLSKRLKRYLGVGISIQASEICAIDVDKCFAIKNDLSSADKRALDILDRFKNVAYCEFSFSGNGLRVLFRYPIIKDYSDKYFIKNKEVGTEYYQPSNSSRYVTVTGIAIHNNTIRHHPDLQPVLLKFLEDYMRKPEGSKSSILTSDEETRTIEQLMVEVKRLYFKNNHFMNLWFGQAPGSGKNESELDYQLMCLLFENITQDDELILQIFESSPYFKSKDAHHIEKWTRQEYRYPNYILSSIRRGK